MYKNRLYTILSTDKVINEVNAWLKSSKFDVTVILKRGFLHPDDLYIASLTVPKDHRYKGIAHKVLSKLISVSDKYGILLTLEASEVSESSDWLQDWYLRHGFDYDAEGYGDYGPYMTRYPKRKG